MGAGEKIHQIRKMAGMAQEELELAEKNGCFQADCLKMGDGASSPDLENAIRLCRLFQISLDDFVKGEQEVEKEEKISLQDLVRINRRTQCMSIILISGLFFLIIGVLAALFKNSGRQIIWEA